MCAALTAPIIKDGYRLYPGMPVSGSAGVGGHRGVGRSGASQQKTPKGRHQNGLLIPQQHGGRSSPPDSLLSTSESPPRNGNLRGSPHQVLLQPRVRTSSNQSQMSARSSFDVGPTTIRPDLIRGRSALSTSQLYMQQRRELAIQQQLRKQELARRQQAQQQQQSTSTKNRKSSSPVPSSHLAQRSDSNGNDSAITDYDAEDCLNLYDDNHSRRRIRKSSPGDQNNNKETNPLRKLLKRLGIGFNNASNHHHNHRSEANSFSEGSIEQAMPALPSLSQSELSVAVEARH